MYSDDETLFIEKNHAIKETSKIEPSFEDYDSSSKTKSSSKELSGITETSFLYKMKPRSPHLHLKISF